MRIGIFDSGVGGLTVYKEIRKHFPTEEIIYFGDTARVPYGSKSQHTIIDYSLQNARFLVQQGAQIIVVACNTATAVALETLHQQMSVPVIGVINAGAKQAIAMSKNGNIGIIGTDGTINSNAYLNAIREINPNLVVIEKACPLFVALAEEGWQDHHVTRQVAEIYLSDLLTQGIDTLVLGCTHYPILKNTIQAVCGEKVALVDSAEAICEDLDGLLRGSSITTPRNDRVNTPQTPNPKPPVIDHFFVSDNEEKFRRIAQAILGTNDIDLKRVKAGETWHT